MDVHDGGSGSPQGPNTSREAEAEAPPARDAVPRPRVELSGPEPSSRAEQTDSEPAPRAGTADSERAPRAETADLVGDPAGDAVGDPVGDPVAGPVSEPRRPGPRTGVAALSPRYQVGAALALAVVAVAVCVHVGMVFLHVAPSNTVTKAHGKAIEDWIYPEFEQNWKLFAPNPLQQNIAVQVRAQVRTVDGGSRTTGWYDLSAQDGRAIDGNLLPSHTQQNELRRAWDFFTATHDNDNRPVGLRGALSETYLRRIVVLRLERGAVAGDDGVVERIQVRSQTTNVTPPKWSTEKVSMSPVYRELPWWSVPDGETEGGTR
ncbi:hypothetical protein G9272_22995 [Streptomyces asoensis]|uniref:Uncharacterized protein n=1 Tax=Streptomyces asoensis TaxID=249586 RepID=A0A6M4X3Q7_9ACTN|nr:DUF5819 family protein [Streptomyces asoensis]QJT02813.1 hypothetical protein G9272_22995 [Streptomyces asoensis]